jgi:ABC-type spermidine/putrescine transport system permease subunit II
VVTRAFPRKFQPGEQIEGSIPLIQVVVTLIVVGVLLWLVNRFIPMQGTIKSILNAVVVICVALWLLNIFGVLHSLNGIRVGR